MGVFLYLTGMNDEALHYLGVGWLGLGRWGQTVAVLAALALVAYFTQGALSRRRSAYRSAVQAAGLGGRHLDDSVAAPTGLETKGLR